MSDVGNFVLKLLAGGAVTGIGILCYCGWSRRERIDNSEEWPLYVRKRINKTFVYLCGSVCITAGSAIFVYQSPKLLNFFVDGETAVVAFLGNVFLNISTLSLCLCIPYDRRSRTVKHLAWVLHCCSVGIMYAPLGILGGPMIFEATKYTAGIIGGFAAVATCAPDKRYLDWGGPLGMGLSVIFVSSIGALMSDRSSAVGQTFDSISLFGGLALFCGYILYDTQVLIYRAEKYPLNQPDLPYDPIIEQINLYLDALNIFIRILRLLAKAEAKRK